VISAQKKDIDENLQRYNKINGKIGRKLGPEISIDIKLYLHNITLTATFNDGNKIQVLK
jgi:hypothetical protein